MIPGESLGALISRVMEAFAALGYDEELAAVATAATINEWLADELASC